MPPALPLSRLSAALLLAAAVPDRAAPIVDETLAGPDLTGPVTAIATDDTGRIYLSLTGRPQRGGDLRADQNPDWLREDRAVFSIGGRRTCVQRWIESGSVRQPVPAGAESVVCLTDAVHGGRADERTVMADGFNDLLDGPAGGITVLASGAVMFGCSPALWRIEDDNQDRRADRRIPVLSGMGIRTGSGQAGIGPVIEGTDGFLYFATSDRGARLTSPEGRRFVLEDTGGVFRCRLDGSDLSLLATGLRQPAGMAMDMRGRLFVADVAQDGGSTRLLQVLPGADFGWDAAIPDRHVFSGENPEPWMLPAVAILPVRATGLIVRQSVADNGSLPVLLMADGRPGGGIVRLELKDENGRLTASPAEKVWSDGAAMALASAPDGSLIWADGGRDEFPSVASRLVRRPPAGSEAAACREGAELLAGGLRALPSAQLAELLEHPHPLVRIRARDALAARGFVESLDVFVRTAKRSPSIQARLNAVRGLAALAAAKPMLLNEIVLLLGSTEPDIRAVALQVAGEGGNAGPPAELLRLLRDPSIDVRIDAAAVIAKLKPPGAAEALTAALAANEENHPGLQHALTMALAGVLRPGQILTIGRESASPKVRPAAMNALRHLHSPELAGFLDDDHAETVAAAVSAIYDQRILPAWPALAAVLTRVAEKPSLRLSGVVKRCIAAALRTGGAAEAAAVAGVAALPENELAPELREAALRALREWDEPPVVEAVHQRYDPPLPRPPGLTRAYLVRLLPKASHAPPASPEALIALAGSAESPGPRRVDALQQLAASQPAKALEWCRKVLPNGGTPEIRAAARSLIIRLDAPGASYAQISEAMSLGSPQEIQAVLTLAARFDSKQAEVLWAGLGRKLVDGDIGPAVQVEVLEGITRRDTSTRGKFRNLLQMWEASLDEVADPAARWRMCEAGGDPDKGRILFESAPHTGCYACHSLNGRGGTSGPELDGVGARLMVPQLLTSLVLPSADITKGYGQVTVRLHSGASVSGLLHSRDDESMLIVTEQGGRRIFAEAADSVSDPVSPMPSCAAILTPREIRDLVAWLATLK